MTQSSAILYDWTGAPLDRLPDRIQYGASAFILNERGHLLLQLRQDNRHWAMPGGRQDVGESITQTCVREVWEETGLHVRVTRLIGIYTDPTQFLVARYPSGEVVQICNVCFECEIIGGRVTLSPESVEIGFYPLDALPAPMLLTHKIRIQDALAYAPQPFIR
ncbi:MAG: NUDIX domain-containing protein [Anaerolineae bacterium]|nr:NUDIX domain-containing protein [Candidatus Roseilinea sp.]MDW8448536.1 NUDIX domain-containing protein [Anaerolineae bacterium]